MSDGSLLPPNATATERALEGALAARLQALQPKVLATLWNPATCPASALPWLAWQLSVDDWDEDWSESVKRAVIAASIDIHRRKGTVAAVRQAIAALGIPAASIGIEERLSGYTWAHWGITLQSPVTVQQADAIRRAAELVAPARQQLVRIRANLLLRHNNTIKRRDGTYTHGSVAFEG